MCGLVRFCSSAHGRDQALVGADFWVQSDELGTSSSASTLLAMDNDGYQNITPAHLPRLSSAVICVQGARHRQGPLGEHAKGVIVPLRRARGDVGVPAQGNRQMVEQCLAFYQHHFPDAYYLELLRTGRPDEEVYLHMAVALATEFEVPVVATNEVVFLGADDFDATRSGWPSTTATP